jgi:hypothetical protein
MTSGYPHASLEAMVMAAKSLEESVPTVGSVFDLDYGKIPQMYFWPKKPDEEETAKLFKKLARKAW